jgi:branched-chain amino acid aminotransferase
MEWRYTRRDLTQAVLRVIRDNEFCNCYIRLIAFYGPHSLSLNPKGCPVEVFIFAWPWEAYLGSKALDQGIHVAVSSWRKFSSAAIPAAAKACGQWALQATCGRRTQ